jgi:Fe-S protein assembly co-chaperone HscB
MLCHHLFRQDNNGSFLSFTSPDLNILIRHALPDMFRRFVFLTASVRVRCFSHFHKLGVTPGFKQSSSTLQKAFHAKQKELHSDVTKTTSTEQSSSECNVAYETLKSPLHRSIYMLQMFHDVDIDNLPEKYQTHVEQTTRCVMEWNEMCEENGSASEHVTMQMVLQKHVITQCLEDAWCRYEQNASPDLLDAVVKYTIQLKFITQACSRL